MSLILAFINLGSALEKVMFEQWGKVLVFFGGLWKWCVSSRILPHVMFISASHAQSLSSRHAIPCNGSYCHQLSWAPTHKHPGFPVPVLVVSEKCVLALAVQPHVPQSLMFDYTSWLPSPCIGHVMIVRLRNWSAQPSTLRCTLAHNQLLLLLPPLRTCGVYVWRQRWWSLALPLGGDIVSMKSWLTYQKSKFVTAISDVIPFWGQCGVVTIFAPLDDALIDLTEARLNRNHAWTPKRYFDFHTKRRKKGPGRISLDEGRPSQPAPT